MTAGAIALIVLAVFLLIIAFSAVRIVPQARATSFMSAENTDRFQQRPGGFLTCADSATYVRSRP